VERGCRSMRQVCQTQPCVSGFCRDRMDNYICDCANTPYTGQNCDDGKRLLVDVNNIFICVYFSLFILATGCLYGLVVLKCISHFRFLEDSARYRKLSQFQKLLLVSPYAKCLSSHSRGLDLMSHPKDCFSTLYF
jgi:hypothetical protein